MGLEALTEAIDQLEEELSALYDGESLVALLAQQARLESVITRATGRFDTSGEWALDGAQTPGAWLATRGHLPRAGARRLVNRARRLRHLPACQAAWARGELTGAHVDALASVRTEVTGAALERDEELLVEKARTLRFEQFTCALAYWHQHADPDGIEATAESRRAGRDVFLTQSYRGMWLGQMTLDPVAGAIVSAELGRIETELFEADWATATQALGHRPALADLARTRAQRRADALVEMATRSQIAQENGRRPEPLFSVLVGYETFHGRIVELAQGTTLTPGALVPWLDQAVVERAVFTPERRVECSVTARLFTGATRHAIELRDRECVNTYCDRPARQCQVDHIVEYGQGGLTTQENGRVLCGFHNRQRNQRPPPGE